MVFTGIRRGDLYIVDFTKKAQPKTCFIAKSSKGWLWHTRLGHVGTRNLDKLIKGNHILGVNDDIFVGERSNFKNFLRTRKIMVMHSNERESVVYVPS